MGLWRVGMEQAPGTGRKLDRLTRARSGAALETTVRSFHFYVSFGDQFATNKQIH